MTRIPQQANRLAWLVESLLECSSCEELALELLDCAACLGAPLPLAILARDGERCWDVLAWRGAFPADELARVRARLQARIGLEGSGWSAAENSDWACVCAQSRANFDADALQALLHVTAMLAEELPPPLQPRAPFPRRRSEDDEIERELGTS